MNFLIFQLLRLQTMLYVEVGDQPISFKGLKRGLGWMRREQSLERRKRTPGGRGLTSLRAGVAQAVSRGTSRQTPVWVPSDNNN